MPYTTFLKSSKKKRKLKIDVLSTNLSPHLSLIQLCISQCALTSERVALVNLKHDTCVLHKFNVHTFCPPLLLSQTYPLDGKKAILSKGLGALSSESSNLLCRTHTHQNLRICIQYLTVQYEFKAPAP